MYFMRNPNKLNPKNFENIYILNIRKNYCSFAVGNIYVYILNYYYTLIPVILLICFE